MQVHCRDAVCPGKQQGLRTILRSFTTAAQHSPAAPTTPNSLLVRHSSPPASTALRYGEHGPTRWAEGASPPPDKHNCRMSCASDPLSGPRDFSVAATGVSWRGSPVPLLRAVGAPCAEVFSAASSWSCLPCCSPWHHLARSSPGWPNAPSRAGPSVHRVRALPLASRHCGFSGESVPFPLGLSCGQQL